MTSELPLGREVAYPRAYDPSLLFPIARAQGRAALGFGGGGLPFAGHDRWHAYELSWLDGRGRPLVETATLLVPAESPNLVESKSLKLYLNSLNGTRFDSRADVQARISADLSAAAGAPVAVEFGLPPVDAGDGAATGAPAPVSLDGLDLACDEYDAPNAALLTADAGARVDEVLHSALLKSNCPVTGQPDWASIRVAYRGPRIDRAGLLRYLVSFREHAGFHEQCVEQVFVDVMARCRPEALSVEARYTRRGGLDINPWRATPGLAPPAAARDPRQ
ncbi:NADPH-dependent 7-cyano-7-deazaguanine reductase QueF [Luteimonas sp. MC1750]|uniref:NADPH-dependent 7-cyano-7-deazaguanine reductase QueF n=1 Tax=Luteimonas sp. MC1750 TaxID=2799326 RepID=UPI0018F0DEE6|nr:NADPH-dependent 7-cyano-7-deazaguanine reductase QueF [Luteimonas sp. MC1750]MBJ6985215.1 NADPH-dependent 7-cyano-7-deazaguanine reductase QueF [Luteimonas sp. MC1750]QQO05863.1 NADPH-dependent 7-cyano-7-deazaguanine reductase QueF [Luteimonas sp. MC1750]